MEPCESLLNDTVEGVAPAAVEADAADIEQPVPQPVETAPQAPVDPEPQAPVEPVPQAAPIPEVPVMAAAPVSEEPVVSNQDVESETTATGAEPSKEISTDPAEELPPTGNDLFITQAKRCQLIMPMPISQAHHDLHCH